MLDDDTTTGDTSSENPADGQDAPGPAEAPAPAKKATRSRKTAARTRTTTTMPAVEPPAAESAPAAAPDAEAAAEPSPDAAPPAKKAAARKTAAKKAPAKKTAARRTTKKAAAAEVAPTDAPAPTDEVGAEPAAEPVAEPGAAEPATGAMPLFQPPPRTTPRKRTQKRVAPVEEPAADEATEATEPTETAVAGGDTSGAQGPDDATPRTSSRKSGGKKKKSTADAGQGSDDADGAADAADEGEKPAGSGKKSGKKSGKGKKSGQRSADAGSEPAEGATPDDEVADDSAQTAEPDETDQVTAGETTETGESGESGEPDESDEGDESGDDGEGASRRRRRRGGRRRGRRSGGGSGDDGEGADTEPQGGGQQRGGSQSGPDSDTDSEGDPEGSDSGGDSGGDSGSGGGSRRRRRRRRSGDSDGGDTARRNPEDEITSVSGSTRLEAKKQRRREGREAGRRRAPIVSEAEFLARREAVDRVMVIRQREDLTQIAVLEDGVLVEHYVARESQTSMIGNVYLGRVQNVLPSMEAAFIDIGKGRNAVLYAGEVNWQALGHKDGQPRKIESVLSSGQTILVQVTKDPIGHKGARLTGQVSLPGRFLVYVPEGNTSGISRKLPDTERNRLKTLLKQIVPDGAGVIVRTAAEGASEEELTLDVERLTARWQDIESKVSGGKSPQLLYGEPDLTLKVVRDLFTEDFGRLVVEGDDAWDLVDGYVSHLAPDLRDRLEHHQPDGSGDAFAAYRIDEQIAKGLDRKVWLPSGGSLVIDRTEAMTVVDVNTGKFTGSGGNLEETVTKNNLEAAEEMVRQLRLRDIGGIIVIDFIDMVLESNRDLVLRRLVECLGRDRTRHQVAEVTSLGLVQMTRKRIGTGLLEAFTDECEHCKGRGLVVHDHPVDPKQRSDDDGRGRGGRGSRSGRGGRGGGGNSGNGGNGDGGSGRGNGNGSATAARTVGPPSPADLANSRPPEERPDEPVADEDQSQDQPQERSQDRDQSQDRAQSRAEEQEQVVGDAVTGEAAPELPAVNDAASADEVVVGEPVTPDQSEPQTESQPESQSEPQPEPQPEPVDPAPRVVTSTRRRRAGRPAGPPVAPTGDAGQGPADESGSETAETDADDSAETSEDGSLIAHVPVKRKGARKR